MPATPGRVRVAWVRDMSRQQQQAVDEQGDHGDPAEQQTIGQHDEAEDHQEPPHQGRNPWPARTALGAQFGAHGALLDHVQLGRQGAGAQQDRQVVGGLGREAALDLRPEPPVMAVLMRGADRILPSSTMANSLPTFSLVVWPKRWVPTPLKWKLTTGSPLR